MPTPGDVFPWKLLKKVSRSFYLTLRMLPSEVRESISLAYLLARMSDTEADGAETPGERELLSRREEILTLLSQSPDRQCITEVWQTIREGQDFDKMRFHPKGSPPLSFEELDRYTYLVAGSVGEFWTSLCANKLSSFSSLPQDQMSDLGIRFGKGLQLVNILRDRAKDARAGRIYVTQEQIPATLAAAAANLNSAEVYCRAIRPRSLRAACRLPVILARETLALIEREPLAQRVKVPRWRVWISLLRALIS